MAVGFVLVSAKPMEEHAVYNALLRVEEIIEVHPLFGEYDLILKIDVSSVEEVGEIVVNRVRTIEGVLDTKTLTGVRI
jgi:DNA-binding Lrp family transcriptional regulator